METMNIALPENLKSFVQNQVEMGGYSSVSEYVRELIRKDQKERAREALEAEILKGLDSGEATPMTADDWRAIREEVQKRYAKRVQQT
ncbi:MAG: addiction module antitoxin [Candidatus Entotheonella factor]|uniref:Addiction module antitoxin n=1 Tax=Entotheonella factor TaxID=1429438 RepID=W4LNJ9_ENTF1|nr:MAG: addiction module antitoxin [Candidatus Entotheonella factor]